MTIKLPKELMGNLPAPDSQGMVRVTVAMSVAGDGTAEIEEINDEPVPGDDDNTADSDADTSATGETPDDMNPMPSKDLPDLSKMPY